MADRSITLLKDDAHLLPINPLNPPKNIQPGAQCRNRFQSRRGFPVRAAPAVPSARTEAVDPRIPEDLAARIVRSAAEADVIVCATLVRLTSGYGSIALPESQRALLDRIIAAGKPVIWIAFGNPYLLRLYPQVSSYMCAFGYSDGSYVAAAKALSGEIAMTGKTPVSIPGYFEVGDGMQVPKLDMTLKPPRKAQACRARSTKPGSCLLPMWTNRRFRARRWRSGIEAVWCWMPPPAGSITRRPRPDVTGDTIYDLASLSKVVGTTSAAMMAVESGRLLLDAPVQDYVPEFRGANKEKVQVTQLLQHSAGLPAWLPIYKDVQGYPEFMKRVYATPPGGPPGTKRLYSDLGMILSGEILARAWGRTPRSISLRPAVRALGHEIDTLPAPEGTAGPDRAHRE